MRTIWNFGCSFSSGYLDVPQEKSYPNLLGKEIGCNVVNNSRPGNCNEKIFYDLTSNLDKINENDIILYQFSSFNRVGFFKNGDPNNYFSSAGIPELGVVHKSKEKSFIDYSVDDLNVMLDFILKWQPKRTKFTLQGPLNILKYLEKTKKTTNIILFLTNEMLYYDNQVLILPKTDNQKNLSLNDYLDEKGLTIGHEYPDKYPFGDTHPGFKGHQEIIKKIKEKLK